MIILDACALIAFFDEDDAHHAAAQQLMTAAADDVLGASPISLAELLVGPARQSRDQVDAMTDALARLEVKDVGFPDDAAVRLALMRAETGLKMPDCCVLLAADDAGADAVGTFDKPLSRAAKARGFRVRGAIESSPRLK
ncbi:MAG: type II toxin-antitoxin system VapC family toxin [Actinomycetia bacterium]|nr:type II toxin-antitoxin system VapC family toxin [Actinomycetes bacterium]